MKKFFSIITVLTLVFSLSACSKPDCDGCGKKNGGVHVVAEGTSEEGHYCDDCNRVIKMFAN